MEEPKNTCDRVKTFEDLYHYQELEESKYITSKDTLVNAYKVGNKEQREMLKNLFAIDFDKEIDVRERIKTFEDAYKELQKLEPDNPLIKQYDNIIRSNIHLDGQIVAFIKLRIIVAALNEGWEPQFIKEEKRYYPWFSLLTKGEYNNLNKGKKKKWCVPCSSYHTSPYCEFVFIHVLHESGSSCNSISCGFQLAFKTQELAAYAAKQFIDIWVEFIFGEGSERE